MLPTDLAEGVDFEPVNASLFFPIGSVGGDTVCTHVTAIDDYALEKEEYFVIYLESEPTVEVHTPSVPLHIIDDDGQQTIYERISP